MCRNNLFERKSVVKFIHELNVINKLPILNVLIDAIHDTFSIFAFIKNTKSGDCLNYDCDLPSRYKDECYLPYSIELT